jgi:predicted RNA-binding Zn-ribbon protein involved in translation (DUF1610 family)
LRSSLTVRLKPYHDESITSFLFRIAQKNGLRILQLLNTVKANKIDYIQSENISSLDINTIAFINLYKLKSISGQNNIQLLDYTFSNAINIFCSNGKLQERTRFFSGLFNEDFFYCPICLLQRNYHKIIWRIKDINVCLEHRVKLTNICGSCGRVIKYNSLQTLYECPYCNEALGKNRMSQHNDIVNYNQIVHLHETWKEILSDNTYKLSSSEIAFRILYLLSNQEAIFDRKKVSDDLGSEGRLQSLLQYARETLNTNRVLHFSFIFSIISKYKISMKCFLDLSVPYVFKRSIMEKRIARIGHASCIAPWCSSYGKNGGLLKTGTSFKRQKSGEILAYYLYCSECGCEYAYDEEHNIRERTYFIYSHEMFLRYWYDGIGLKELANKVELSEEKVRRSQCYFYSRNMFVCSNDNKYDVDNGDVERFIEALRNKISLKEIQKWIYWLSYRHFLIIRFHKDIIGELRCNSSKSEKIEPNIRDVEKVKRGLELLYAKDINITINEVCNVLKVVPQTIQYWQCDFLIAEFKLKQRVKRAERQEAKLYERFQLYLATNSLEMITIDKLCKELGIGRTVLWRSFPVLARYLKEKVREHNRNCKYLLDDKI